MQRLALIADDQQRWPETRAYLQTLPPWPQPLAGQDAPSAPAPDPALPLRSSAEGITLAAAPITGQEIDDPIRSTLHAALQGQVADLIRIAGNLDEATYRESCKLRDLLEPGLPAMNPLLVHLSIEALRRLRATASPEADRDYVLALDAVTATGPGLTLDTRPVQLFIERGQRNRLDHLVEANAEAQIRLANSIAASDLSAPDLQALARLAADVEVTDQFTAIRPTLARNFTLKAGILFVLGTVAAGPLGGVGDQAWGWLNANASDIRTLSVIWGEPFAAWIAPILDRAQQIVAGAKHMADRLLPK